MPACCMKGQALPAVELSPEACHGQPARRGKSWSLSFRGTGPAAGQWQEEKALSQPLLWLYLWPDVKGHRESRKDA